MNEEYTKTRFHLGAATIPIPPRFFIITGHNPFGRMVSKETNAEMNEILRQQIEHEGWPYFEVTGQCQDHAEAGYGVVCSRDDAILLGQEFQQDAIYEIHDDKVILVDCKEEEEDVSVGRWSDLLVTPS